MTRYLNTNEFGFRSSFGIMLNAIRLARNVLYYFGKHERDWDSSNKRGGNTQKKMMCLRETDTQSLNARSPSLHSFR